MNKENWYWFCQNIWLYPGSARHSSRRIGARNRKEDGFAMTIEGKTSRRGGGGGGGPSSHEVSQTKALPPYAHITHFLTCRRSKCGSKNHHPVLDIFALHMVSFSCSRAFLLSFPALNINFLFPSWIIRRWIYQDNVMFVLIFQALCIKPIPMDYDVLQRESIDLNRNGE